MPRHNSDHEQDHICTRSSLETDKVDVNMDSLAYYSPAGVFKDRDLVEEFLYEAPVLAFDVESTGTDIAKAVPLGFSAAYETNSAVYTDLGSPQFWGLLTNPNRDYVAHNAKFDWSMMARAGIVVNNLWDTMIAAHLLLEKVLSLKHLASKYLQMDIMAFEDLQKPPSEMTLEELATYSCPHSIAALRLWRVFEPKLKGLRLLDLFLNVEMRLVPVLSDMELNGIAVDTERLRSLGEDIRRSITALKTQLDALSGCPGMNYNSGDQVADLLFKKLGLRPGRLTRGGKRPSVDEEYLKQIRHKHRIIPVYLQWKGYQKLLKTYIETLPGKVVDGRIHPSFNQAGTRTGRLSCSNPNLQNIPARNEDGKKIRTAFIASPGHVLVKADYNQIELRVMSHYSKCPAMIRAFLRGQDPHEQTAIRVFGDKKRRPEAKTLNFQIIYGGGKPEHRQRFYDAYPEVKAWSERTVKANREAGYVRTLKGRIRAIPEWDSWDTVPHGDREAISAIIQGSAAEAVKIGMRKAWEVLQGSGAKMVLQVHDELVFEVPEKEVPSVVDVLEQALIYQELLVPLTVSISTGENWGSMKEWNGEH